MMIRQAATVLLLCIPAAAGAQSNAAKFELTPYGGYRFGGTFSVEESSGSYKLQDSTGYGLLVNFPHRSNTKWEVLYARQSTDAEFSQVTINDSAVDVTLQTLQIGGIYLFDSDKLQPFLSATIGATHVKAESTGSGSDTFWSASIGLGMLFNPTSRVDLRLEARAHGTFMNSSTDLFCRTGPDLNACAIRLEGDLVSQIETFAGVVFRF